MTRKRYTFRRRIKTTTPNWKFMDQQQTILPEQNVAATQETFTKKGVVNILHQVNDLLNFITIGTEKPSRVSQEKDYGLTTKNKELLATSQSSFPQSINKFSTIHEQLESQKMTTTHSERMRLSTEKEETKANAVVQASTYPITTDKYYSYLAPARKGMTHDPEKFSKHLNEVLHAASTVINDLKSTPEEESNNEFPEAAVESEYSSNNTNASHFLKNADNIIGNMTTSTVKESHKTETSFYLNTEADETSTSFASSENTEVNEFINAASELLADLGTETSEATGTSATSEEVITRSEIQSSAVESPSTQYTGDMLLNTIGDVLKAATSELSKEVTSELSVAVNAEPEIEEVFSPTTRTLETTNTEIDLILNAASELIKDATSSVEYRAKTSPLYANLDAANTQDNELQDTYTMELSSTINYFVNKGEEIIKDLSSSTTETHSEISTAGAEDMAYNTEDEIQSLEQTTISTVESAEIGKFLSDVEQIMQDVTSTEKTPVPEQLVTDMEYSEESVFHRRSTRETTINSDIENIVSAATELIATMKTIQLETHKEQIYSPAPDISDYSPEIDIITPATEENTEEIIKYISGASAIFEDLSTTSFETTEVPKDTEQPEPETMETESYTPLNSTTEDNEEISKFLNIISEVFNDVTKQALEDATNEFPAVGIIAKPGSTATTENTSEISSVVQEVTTTEQNELSTVVTTSEITSTKLPVQETSHEATEIDNKLQTGSDSFSKISTPSEASPETTSQLTSEDVNQSQSSVLTVPTSETLLTSNENIQTQGATSSISEVTTEVSTEMVLSVEPSSASYQESSSTNTQNMATEETLTTNHEIAIVSNPTATNVLSSEMQSEGFSAEMASLLEVIHVAKYKTLPANVQRLQTEGTSISENEIATEKKSTGTVFSSLEVQTEGVSTQMVSLPERVSGNMHETLSNITQNVQTEETSFSSQEIATERISTEALLSSFEIQTEGFSTQMASLTEIVPISNYETSSVSMEGIQSETASVNYETATEGLSTEISLSSDGNMNIQDMQTEMVVLSTTATAVSEVLSTEVAQLSETASANYETTTESLSTEFAPSSEANMHVQDTQAEIASLSITTAVFEDLSTEAASLSETASANYKTAPEILSIETIQSSEASMNVQDMQTEMAVLSTTATAVSEVLSTEVVPLSETASVSYETAPETLSTEIAPSSETIMNVQDTQTEIASLSITTAMAEDLSTEAASLSETASANYGTAPETLSTETVQSSETSMNVQDIQTEMVALSTTATAVSEDLSTEVVRLSETASVSYETAPETLSAELAPSSEAIMNVQDTQTEIASLSITTAMAEDLSTETASLSGTASTNYETATEGLTAETATLSETEAFSTEVISLSGTESLSNLEVVTEALSTEIITTLEITSSIQSLQTEETLLTSLESDELSTVSSPLGSQEASSVGIQIIQTEGTISQVSAEVSSAEVTPVSEITDFSSNQVSPQTRETENEYLVNPSSEVSHVTTELSSSEESTENSSQEIILQSEITSANTQGSSAEGNLPEESFVSGQVPSASEEPFSIQPTTVSIPVTSFEDTSLVSSPRAEQIEEQLSSFEFVTNNLQSSEPLHISDHFAFSGEEKITVATNQPLSQQEVWKKLGLSPSTEDKVIVKVFSEASKALKGATEPITVVMHTTNGGNINLHKGENPSESHNAPEEANEATREQQNELVSYSSELETQEGKNTPESTTELMTAINVPTESISPPDEEKLGKLTLFTNRFVGTEEQMGETTLSETLSTIGQITNTEKYEYSGIFSPPVETDYYDQSTSEASRESIEPITVSASFETESTSEVLSEVGLSETVSNERFPSEVMISSNQVSNEQMVQTKEVSLISVLESSTSKITETDMSFTAEETKQSPPEEAIYSETSDITTLSEEQHKANIHASSQEIETTQPGTSHSVNAHPDLIAIDNQIASVPSVISGPITELPSVPRTSAHTTSEEEQLLTGDGFITQALSDASQAVQEATEPLSLPFTEESVEEFLSEMAVSDIYGEGATTKSDFRTLSSMDSIEPSTKSNIDLTSIEKEVASVLMIASGTITQLPSIPKTNAHDTPEEIPSTPDEFITQALSEASQAVQEATKPLPLPFREESVEEYSSERASPDVVQTKASSDLANTASVEHITKVNQQLTAIEKEIASIPLVLSGPVTKLPSVPRTSAQATTEEEMFINDDFVTKALSDASQAVQEATEPLSLPFTEESVEDLLSELATSDIYNEGDIDTTEADFRTLSSMDNNEPSTKKNIDLTSIEKEVASVLMVASGTITNLPSIPIINGHVTAEEERSMPDEFITQALSAASEAVQEATKPLPLPITEKSLEEFLSEMASSNMGQTEALSDLANISSTEHTTKGNPQLTAIEKEIASIPLVISGPITKLPAVPKTSFLASSEEELSDEFVTQAFKDASQAVQAATEPLSLPYTEESLVEFLSELATSDAHDKENMAKTETHFRTMSRMHSIMHPNKETIDLIAIQNEIATVPIVISGTVTHLPSIPKTNAYPALEKTPSISDEFITQALSEASEALAEATKPISSDADVTNNDLSLESNAPPFEDATFSNELSTIQSTLLTKALIETEKFSNTRSSLNDIENMSTSMLGTEHSTKANMDLMTATENEVTIVLSLASSPITQFPSVPETAQTAREEELSTSHELFTGVIHRSTPIKLGTDTSTKELLLEMNQDTNLNNQKSDTEHSTITKTQNLPKIETSLSGGKSSSRSHIEQELALVPLIISDPTNQPSIARTKVHPMDKEKEPITSNELITQLISEANEALAEATKPLEISFASYPLTKSHSRFTSANTTGSESLTEFMNSNGLHDILTTSLESHSSANHPQNTEAFTKATSMIASKHTFADSTQATHLKEEADEVQLQHFSQHETSTVCEICNETEQEELTKGHGSPIGSTAISTRPTKHTIPTTSAKTLATEKEVADDADLQHFSRHETSTICELCDETETRESTAIHNLHKGSNTINQRKHTVSAVTPIFSATREEFKEENMEAFTHHQTSTICELCDEELPEQSKTNKQQQYEYKESVHNRTSSEASLPYSSVHYSHVDEIMTQKTAKQLEEYISLATEGLEKSTSTTEKETSNSHVAEETTTFYPTTEKLSHFGLQVSTVSGKIAISSTVTEHLAVTEQSSIEYKTEREGTELSQRQPETNIYGTEEVTQTHEGIEANGKQLETKAYSTEEVTLTQFINSQQVTESHIPEEHTTAYAVAEEVSQILTVTSENILASSIPSAEQGNVESTHSVPANGIETQESTQQNGQQSVTKSHTPEELTAFYTVTEGVSELEIQISALTSSEVSISSAPTDNSLSLEQGSTEWEHKSTQFLTENGSESHEGTEQGAKQTEVSTEEVMLSGPIESQQITKSRTSEELTTFYTVTGVSEPEVQIPTGTVSEFSLSSTPTEHLPTLEQGITEWENKSTQTLPVNGAKNHEGTEQSEHQAKVSMFGSEEVTISGSIESQKITKNYTPEGLTTFYAVSEGVSELEVQIPTGTVLEFSLSSAPTEHLPSLEQATTEREYKSTPSLSVNGTKIHGGTEGSEQQSEIHPSGTSEDTISEPTDNQKITKSHTPEGLTTFYAVTERVSELEVQNPTLTTSEFSISSPTAEWEHKTAQSLLVNGADTQEGTEQSEEQTDVSMYDTEEVTLPGPIESQQITKSHAPEELTTFYAVTESVPELGVQFSTGTASEFSISSAPTEHLQSTTEQEYESSQSLPVNGAETHEGTEEGELQSGVSTHGTTEVTTPSKPIDSQQITKSHTPEELATFYAVTEGVSELEVQVSTVTASEFSISFAPTEYLQNTTKQEIGSSQSVNVAETHEGTEESEQQSGVSTHATTEVTPYKPINGQQITKSYTPEELATFYAVTEGVSELEVQITTGTASALTEHLPSLGQNNTEQEYESSQSIPAKGAETHDGTDASEQQSKESVYGTVEVTLSEPIDSNQNTKSHTPEEMTTFYAVTEGVSELKVEISTVTSPEFSISFTPSEYLPSVEQGPTEGEYESSRSLPVNSAETHESTLQSEKQSEVSMNGTTEFTLSKPIISQQITKGHILEELTSEITEGVSEGLQQNEQQSQTNDQQYTSSEDLSSSGQGSTEWNIANSIETQEDMVEGEEELDNEIFGVDETTLSGHGDNQQTTSSFFATTMPAIEYSSILLTAMLSTTIAMVVQNISGALATSVETPFSTPPFGNVHTSVAMPYENEISTFPPFDNSNSPFLKGASENLGNTGETHATHSGNLPNHSQKLTSSELYLDLPVYLPNASQTPESFLKYYTTQKQSVQVFDDEKTDITVGKEDFRTMSFNDFDVVTEFAPTTKGQNQSTCLVVAVANGTQVKYVEPNASLAAGEINTAPIAASTDFIVNVLPSSETYTTLKSQTALTEELPLTTVPEQRSSITESKSEFSELTTTTTSEPIVISRPVPNILEETATHSESLVLTTVISKSTESAEEKYATTESSLAPALNTKSMASKPLVYPFGNGTFIEEPTSTTPFSSGIKAATEITTVLSYSTSLESILDTYTTGPASVSLAKGLQENYEPGGCQITDFNQKAPCVCAIDGFVDEIKHIINGSNMVDKVDSLSCHKFIKVKGALVLSNDTSAALRTKRSYQFEENRRLRKREAVKNSEIGSVLNQEIDIQNTDRQIYALTGSKATIHCMQEQVTEFAQNNKYRWTTTSARSITADGTGATIQKDGTLIIDHVVPHDGGNYTCSVTNNIADGGTKNFEHELIVITLPTYTIKENILYNMTAKCELTDVDIMNLYMPSKLRELLCGFQSKICSVHVQQPHCVKKDDRDYIAIGLTISLVPLDAMIPCISQSVCDIGCQMKLYGKITSMVIQNTEIVNKLPVVSRLNAKQVQFVPTEVVHKRSRSPADVTEPAQLIISCPPGFGLKKTEKLCAACPKNSYSTGGESKCTGCPIGQYQPLVGSRSCLTCNSPLQDPACLRVMFSNTKTFRIYAGVGFGALVLIVIICICCSTGSKNRKRHYSHDTRDRYRRYHGERRKYRDADVEQQTVPLLPPEGTKKHRRMSRVPPQPPPLDF